jgi:hypothetical protein
VKKEASLPDIDHDVWLSLAVCCAEADGGAWGLAWISSRISGKDLRLYFQILVYRLLYSHDDSEVLRVSQDLAGGPHVRPADQLKCFCFVGDDG